MHRDADRTTFEEVFSPLAHHLFPDGCPKDDFESTNTTISISKCWPRRCDRSIVSLKDAIQSISNIHQYSQRNGCYPHELLQLCIVACATLCSEEKLPLQSRGGGRSSAAVSHSGLMDGTSYYFIRILQCMVPSGSCTDLECVPSEILRKLLSVASSNKCDTDGKCAVLRFLTLVVQSGCLRFSNKGTQVVSFYYSIPFFMISNVETVVDAVRYLYTITTKYHVKQYRVQRIQQILHQASTTYPITYDEKKNPQRRFTSLYLLLQLYEHYHPSSFTSLTNDITATLDKITSLPPMSTLTINGELSKFLQFPDEIWKRNFTAQVTDWLRNTTKNTTIETHKSSLPYANTSDIFSSAWTTLDFLEDNSIHGISSLLPWVPTSTKTSPSNPSKRQRLVRTVSRASDILSNETIQQFIILSDSNHADSNNASMELIRLRASLPFMLHEEWYEHRMAEDETNRFYHTGRLQLLQALSCFVSHTHLLPSEIVSFITNHILPCYDSSGMYEILFRDILPFCFFTSRHHLQAKVQSAITKIFPTASSSMQHAILSNGLTKVFNTLSKFQRSITPTKEQIVQFSLWVDNLIMSGLVASCEEERRELILLSALDFYDAACDYCLCHTGSSMILFPSPSVIYSCLLSPTPLCIDRACQLLLSYKEMLEEMKQRNITTNQRKAKKGYSYFTFVEEMERYFKIFNCYVWDFCSALWRCPDLNQFFLDNSSSRDSINDRLHSILWTDLTEETSHDMRIHLIKSNLRYTLSITHGAAFSGFASHFLLAQQLNNPPAALNASSNISPDELTGTNKVKYLEYLREVGFSGLYSFLTTFVNSLSTREAKKKKKQTNMNCS